MTILAISRRLPNYAGDIKNNLLKLFSGELEGLTQPQVYGIALTTGYYLKNERLLNDIRSEAKLHLEDEDARACKIAAVTMVMLNNYYNFVTSTQDSKLMELPNGLDTTDISKLDVDKTDFELYSLAVSILSGCSYCINMHTKTLIQRGITLEAIRNAGRITSTLKAASGALDIERLRSYDFAARGPSF